MSLAHDIAAHRDRILADLSAVHDYYFNSQAAWRIVQQYVEQNPTVSITNTATGTTITEVELSGKAQHYVTEYLAISTLQQFVSLFEDFLIGLLRHWLFVHHRAIDKRQILIGTVFEAADLNDAKIRAIDQELNALSYKKLKDWFAFQDSLVHLGCPSDDECQRLAEIKATRDVFIHNRGVANAIYVEKAGKMARFNAGDRVDVPEPYHRESWELIKKVVTEMSAAAIEKA